MQTYKPNYVPPNKQLARFLTFFSPISNKATICLKSHWGILSLQRLCTQSLFICITIVASYIKLRKRSKARCST